MECEISSEIVTGTVTLVLPEDCKGQFPTLFVQLRSGASMSQTTDVSGRQKVADFMLPANGSLSYTRFSKFQKAQSLLPHEDVPEGRALFQMTSWQNTISPWLEVPVKDWKMSMAPVHGFSAACGPLPQTYCTRIRTHEN